MNSTGTSKPANPPSENGLARLLQWMHAHFMWLLVASYLLAAVLPGPGLWIRQISWGHAEAGEITTPMLLLAVLLFNAAAVIRSAHVKQLLEHPTTLVWGLAANWLVPGALVGLLGWGLASLISDSALNGMLVGLALVAAMPIANSSVAWTQNSQGNVALGLGLIVLSIFISPLAAPQMLKLMGLALSDQDTVRCEQLVARFSGAFFILWVILPSLAGFVANRMVGSEAIERHRSHIRFVSSLVLLTLNYTNASLAMPKVFERSAPALILSAAMLAISLQLLGVVTAWSIGKLTHLDRESTIALYYGLGMKHTGLALVLAGEVLGQEPRVILLIVLATLLQHILAGVVDWCLERRIL